MQGLVPALIGTARVLTADDPARRPRVRRAGDRGQPSGLAAARAAGRRLGGAAQRGSRGGDSPGRGGPEAGARPPRPAGRRRGVCSSRPRSTSRRRWNWPRRPGGCGTTSATRSARPAPRCSWPKASADRPARNCWREPRRCSSTRVPGATSPTYAARVGWGNRSVADRDLDARWIPRHPKRCADRDRRVGLAQGPRPRQAARRPARRARGARRGRQPALAGRAGPLGAPAVGAAEHDPQRARSRRSRSRRTTTSPPTTTPCGSCASTSTSTSSSSSARPPTGDACLPTATARRRTGLLTRAGGALPRRLLRRRPLRRLGGRHARAGPPHVRRDRRPARPVWPTKRASTARPFGSGCASSTSTPTTRTAHLDLVRSLSAQRRHGEARRAYRTYCPRLAELDLDPAPFPAAGAGPEHRLNTSGTPCASMAGWRTARWGGLARDRAARPGRALLTGRAPSSSVRRGVAPG